MSFRSAFLFGLFATVSFVSARTSSRTVQGHSIDFSTYRPNRGIGVEEWIKQRGYNIGNYTVGGVEGKTVPRRFDKTNVQIVDGALRLSVLGQQRPSDTVSASQIESTEYFTYGTLETIARATPVKDVCQGIFFYRDDQVETDIELLSSYYTEGYQDLVNPGAQFTNQALVEGQAPTTVAKSFGFDPTAGFHNYTMQWSPSATKFWVDGRLQTTLTKNVPPSASRIMYNNWSNGNPGWSAGPPRQDAHFDIRSFRYTPL
ncbi:glycoside hydrolase family 16 protein [Sporobolomyces koalae]|uniref:glycoside hydrolase family 16 protein n=1 Tax=Sporobolomyces koalae TaxID=500713 RepID=UPI00317B45C0